MRPASGRLPPHPHGAGACRFHGPPSAFITGEHCFRPEISAAYAGDADRFLIQDASTGQVLELSRREYLIGAVAAEMPVSWPDEALKAQAVAAHSYALYCRDHAAPDSIGWLTADRHDGRAA